MHISKWTKYCDLDSGSNKLIFNIGRIYRLQTTLYEHTCPCSLPLRTLTDKENFNIIIGDMMFHP